MSILSYDWGESEGKVQGERQREVLGEGGVEEEVGLEEGEVVEVG